MWISLSGKTKFAAIVLLLLSTGMVWRHLIHCDPYNLPPKDTPSPQMILAHLDRNVEAGNIGVDTQLGPQLGRSATWEDEVPTPHFAAQVITKDLQPWSQTGITKKVLEQSWEQWEKRCARKENGFDQGGADGFRFQVIGGELYIDTNKSGPCCGQTEWWPSKRQVKDFFGTDGMLHASEGRGPLTILGMLEALRRYPGQVPDLDGFMTLGDLPCYPTVLDGFTAGQPPPAFGFSADNRHVDIPFPDFSFWRNEDRHLAQKVYDPLLDKVKITRLQGWDAQLRYLRQSWSKPWKDRKAVVRKPIRRTFARLVNGLLIV